MSVMPACACGCGRPLKKDSKGRMPKFHSDCFSIGKPLGERVRKYLSLRAKEPDRIKKSIEKVQKINKQVSDGTRKPGHWIDGVLRSRDDGYIMIKNRNHHRANNCGYVFQHILIMEKYLGRFLRDGECVHHINRDRSDNRIENLLLLSSYGEHVSLHIKEDKRRDKMGRFRSPERKE